MTEKCHLLTSSGKVTVQSFWLQFSSYVPKFLKHASFWPTDFTSWNLHWGNNQECVERLSYIFAHRHNIYKTKTLEWFVFRNQWLVKQTIAYLHQGTVSVIKNDAVDEDSLAWKDLCCFDSISPGEKIYIYEYREKKTWN